jgi:hypothetical protein
VRIYRLGLSWSFPGLMGGASQGRDCSAPVACVTRVSNTGRPRERWGMSRAEQVRGRRPRPQRRRDRQLR